MYNINRTCYHTLNVSHLVLQLSLSQKIYWIVKLVGAAPTGDATTTSEWPAILLPTKVRLYQRFGGILYITCQLQGEKVRGVLVVNPVNPTGTMFTKHTLETLVDFTEK